MRTTVHALCRRRAARAGSLVFSRSPLVSSGDIADGYDRDDGISTAVGANERQVDYGSGDSG
jgi:hypothetical protein